MNYQEQLRQSAWLDKRKEILLRDNKQCQTCLSTENLTVHHKKYLYGLMAWEYSNYYLITLCKNCHDAIHNTSKASQLFQNWEPPQKIDYSKFKPLPPHHPEQEDLFGELTEVVIVEQNEI